MSFAPPGIPRIGQDSAPGGVTNVRVMTDVTPSPKQLAELSHKFDLHKLNARASLGQYLVKDGELSDGTRYRIETNGTRSTLYIWPVAGGGAVIVPRIYSGVVRDGQIVNVLGKPVLRDFEPTDQCWQYPLARNASVPTGQFSDIKQLAVDPNGGSTPGDSKFATNPAAMYSGMMAQLVQVILGFGKQDAKAGLVTHPQFNWRWDDCHGLAKGPDGVVWLLWANHLHGLLATPLPLAKNTAGMNVLEDVVRESSTLFGGIPTGAGFPAALSAAITDGSVLQLLSTSDMADYFAKTPMSPDMGWSFNDDGSEARNIVYAPTGVVYPPDHFYTSPRTQYFSYYYKLAITLGAVVRGRSAGQPIAVCSATITLLESAEMLASVPWAQCSMPFYSSDYGKLIRPPAKPKSSVETVAGTTYPLMVCYIAGAFETLRAKNRAGGTDIVSERFVDPGLSTNLVDQAAIWPRGMRDAYIVIVPAADGSSSTWYVAARRVGTLTQTGCTADTKSLSFGPLWGSGGTTDAEAYLPPQVNVSMFGTRVHIVYSYDVDGPPGFVENGWQPSIHPLKVKASGDLLAAALVPKPVKAADGINSAPTYWPTPYAFAGYI